MKKVSIFIAITCAVLALCSRAAAQSSLVRLQVVNVPVDSGLLSTLLPDFERATGYQVQVSKGEDVYNMARQGAADLVLSHYGHQQIDDFMADGLGLWPRAVFANQAVLLGPANDPAGIRGIQDAVEAFQRIAQSRSPFIVNNAATEKYLGQVLWEAADEPEQTGWYSDTGLRDLSAVQTADRSQAYVLWGIIPFLKFKENTGSRLETFVTDDPLLQRVMMTVIVNPERIQGVNVAGALALQKYLTTPAAQARIRAFRYPGVNKQLFWPAARDNIGSFLADNSPLPTTADPAINGVGLNPPTVRIGDTVTVIFPGTNLSAQTYFDVRFRRPGAVSDEVVQNWQQGTSGSHAILSGTSMGTWRITGVRAHREPNEHNISFIPVIGTLIVVP